MENPKTDLQICENLGQQRTEWALMRFAWPVLYALLIAIALGLLGEGPLADARIRSDAGQEEAEYKRFATVKSAVPLTVKIQGAGGTGRVVLAHEYLQKVEIRKVTPEPDKVVAESEGLAYLFNTASATPVEVRFVVEPMKAGMLSGWLAVDGGEKRHFTQFVYP